MKAPEARRAMRPVESKPDPLADVAVLFMALDENRIQSLFDRLEENEIRRVSRAMANLGKVDIDQVERVITRFRNDVGRTGTVIGTAETTERLLRRLLPNDKVSEIMDEIRGPEGKTMWEKLANISPEVLATYLRTELAHPLQLHQRRVARHDDGGADA